MANLKILTQISQGKYIKEFTFFGWLIDKYNIQK